MLQRLATMLLRLARMMPGSDSAAGIARRVTIGQTSPVDELDRHVAAHAATHRDLNALCQTRHAAARADATALERRLHEHAGGMPLAGVPVSVKECFGVAGLVTSLGIPGRRWAGDVGDAAIVSRLRSAGAIIVGKGNVPQAMYLHETDNPVWGRTNHPSTAARGPGGSSGGDAALVAAGVVPLAVGTDLAGSIRQPAHACGIAGFMPRSAVIGDGGAFDTVPRLTLVRPRAGFLARSVDDLSLALSAFTPVRQAAGAGSGGGSPPGAGLERMAGRGLRIGWWDAAGPIEPSPAVRRAVHEAVARLGRAGAETVELDAGLADQAAWLHLAVLSADGGADVRGLFGGARPMPAVARLLFLAGVPRWLRPLLAAASEAIGGGIEARGLRATGPVAAAARDALRDRREEIASRFGGQVAALDALVCPVSALPALRHGTAARLLLAAAPCLLANLLDLPAGTVPVARVRPDEERGRTASRDPVIRAAAATDRESRGLPVGVQVVGVPQAAAADDPLRPERAVLEVMRLIECGGSPLREGGLD